MAASPSYFDNAELGLPLFERPIQRCSINFRPPSQFWFACVLLWLIDAIKTTNPENGTAS